jgi:hypothetical protein
MSARLAAAFTTCQIALGVIPSPQILSSRLTRRKIAPSVMAAAPIHSSTARFRPQGNRNGTDVLSLANKVSNHAMIFADLKISRPESH